MDETERYWRDKIADEILTFILAYQVDDPCGQRLADFAVETQQLFYRIAKGENV